MPEPQVMDSAAASLRQLPAPGLQRTYLPLQMSADQELRLRARPSRPQVALQARLKLDRRPHASVVGRTWRVDLSASIAGRWTNSWWDTSRINSEENVSAASAHAASDRMQQASTWLASRGRVSCGTSIGTG